MQRNSTAIVVIVLSVVACLCVCTLALAGGGLYVISATRGLATQIGPIITEIVPVTTRAAQSDTPTPEATIIRTPIPTPEPGSSDTLSVLAAADIPVSDLRLIAMRLKGIPDIPETVSATPADYPVGQELEFNVSNTDTNGNFKVTARLIYKTDNVYFFSDNDASVNAREVKKLVDDFQGQIYPTDREFFGGEWNPGVDGDPRLFILYAHGLGSNVLGYYSSVDEYSHLAHAFSNEKEMFYINADLTGPGDSSLPSVLAHEFQHMIHWYHDRNEETWMNEGSSVLAEFLNGFTDIGFDYSYVADPDLQLNAWTESGNDNTSPHYGAGFLFLDYFLNRFGADATKALVADQANGLRAVEQILQQLNATDQATGAPVTMTDVFADWVVANYLDDPSVADGRYAYHNYPQAPKIEGPTDRYSRCPVQQSATVLQFAADYYEIDCSGQVTISFTGSGQVRVVPTEPHSGRYAFWSNRNDESDMRLTREFDLTGVSSATFDYWAWWQLEDDFDYVYLVASTDGGQSWQILKTPSGTDRNPTGNALGWGYSGSSGGGDQGEWVEEQVDLSQFAGQKVQLGFEYVTDTAVNRAGFMLDDVSIPEIQYSTDFEKGDDGWKAEGFVRMDNLLPQTFVVQLIDQSRQTTVQRLALDGSNTGSVTLDLAARDKVTLVVSGTTLFTTEPASYEFGVK